MDAFYVPLMTKKRVFGGISKFFIYLNFFYIYYKPIAMNNLHKCHLWIIIRAFDPINKLIKY